MATTKKSWRKAKIWKNSFAPKRSAWYAPLAAHIEPRVGIVALVVASIFFFGGVFSIDASFSQLPAQFSTPPVAALSQQTALVAGAAYATDLLHVPGAYIDDSSVPPPAIAPSFPVSKKEAAHLIAFTPLFASALAGTAASIWTNSGGLTASVFVASVYELGNESSSVVASEFNLSAVFGPLNKF